MEKAVPVKVEWGISESIFQRILERRSIWFPFRTALGAWKAAERETIVEAIRKFLTRRQVPFIVEVLKRANGENTSSALFRETLDVWWHDPKCEWRPRIDAFLQLLPQFGNQERHEILENALPVGEFAAIGNRTERRQKIQDAFNTPFFPMILVGNRTMQEGLNLQRQCRRIVHHDLRWNPADIEQRIGRVDRHGSLAQRLLDETGGKHGHILIDTPLLDRTIDPSRYRRVKEREKWFNFLLGKPPESDCEIFDEPEVQPLPVAFTEALRVRLGPLDRASRKHN